jgi:hypothetical protein
MKFLPYTAIDGIPTFPDSFILGLFERMQEEGLVETVFYDGRIKTAEDFLRMMKGMNQLWVVKFNGEIAGFFWLNNFDMRKAEFHFCFFDNLRGTDALEAGRKITGMLINMKDLAGFPLYDLLYGMTEVTNEPARYWCESLGYQHFGVIPAALWNARLQKSVPAHYWYVERGKWNG